MILQEYSFVSKHIDGESNAADGLSRQIFMMTLKSNPHPAYTDTDKENILRHYHITSGHGTAHNMWFLLKGKYNWNGMRQDVIKYVKGCLVCLKNGGEIKNTENNIIQTLFTNELWEIDLLGPLTGTDGTNKFIVVTVDHYSKWLDAEIIEKKDASKTCKAIEKIILRNGTPKTIMTDNGLEFRNSSIQALSQKYGID